MENRIKNYSNLKPETISELQKILHKVNPYVKKFKQFALDSKNIETLQIVLKTDSNIDRRVCNLPTASEIAVILPGNYINIFFIDIILTTT